MRDKIPSFIIKMKVNMKICQFLVEKTKHFEKWSPQR